MSLRREIIDDLSSVAKNLDYVVIRNYEFLFNKTKDIEPDIDLLTLKITSTQRKFIESRGYFLTHKSKYRMTFAKFFSKQKCLFFLDFHIKNLTGNPISYFLEQDMIQNSKKLKNIPIPSPEYYLAALLLRETLAEGFKPKYQSKLLKLLDKVDKKLVVRLLLRSMSKKHSLKLLYLLSKKDFSALERYRSRVFVRFALKNITQYIHTILLIKSQKRIISLIGMDGSGKSTIIKEAEKVLNQNGIKITTFYMGRGGGNIIPMQKPASFVKKRAVNLPSLLKKFIYSSSALIYTLDFIIRYNKHLRFTNGIVLTDRFCSDILLMPNVPKVIRKFFYSLSPKPDKYIYIYNELSVLKKRRPEHEYNDLIRQEKEFEWINKQIQTKKVKNDKLTKTLPEIIKLILIDG